MDKLSKVLELNFTWQPREKVFNSRFEMKDGKKNTGLMVNWVESILNKLSKVNEKGELCT